MAIPKCLQPIVLGVLNYNSSGLEHGEHVRETTTQIHGEELSHQVV